MNKERNERRKRERKREREREKGRKREKERNDISARENIDVFLLQMQLEKRNSTEKEHGVVKMQHSKNRIPETLQ